MCEAIAKISISVFGFFLIPFILCVETLFVGLVETFHRTKFDNELRSGWRHCGLCADVVQSDHQMSVACACIPLRFAGNGSGIASTIATIDHAPRKSAALRRDGSEVSLPALEHSPRAFTMRIHIHIVCLFCRLGLRMASNSPPPRNAPLTSSKSAPIQSHSKRTTDSTPRHFDSSLSSDTGTSTRESECSEEVAVAPLSPSPKQSSLFDSLAAELRAKLNGNGPPLLLPPRDYDTVHRSKGNLVASEMRRCRNSLIVGPTVTKPGISSRGSSGIGSDLAPSPERHEGHTSSGKHISLSHYPYH